MEPRLVWTFTHSCSVLTQVLPSLGQSRDLERSGSVGQKVKRSGGLRKSSVGIKNVQMKADEYEHNWVTRGDFQLHFFNPPLLDEPAGSLSRICNTSSNAGLPATPLKCQGRRNRVGLRAARQTFPRPRCPPNFTFAVRRASGDDVWRCGRAHARCQPSSESKPPSPICFINSNSPLRNCTKCSQEWKGTASLLLRACVCVCCTCCAVFCVCVCV